MKELLEEIFSDVKETINVNGEVVNITSPFIKYLIRKDNFKDDHVQSISMSSLGPPHNSEPILMINKDRWDIDELVNIYEEWKISERNNKINNVLKK